MYSLKVLVLLAITMALAKMGYCHFPNRPLNGCEPVFKAYKEPDMNELRRTLSSSLEKVANSGGPRYRLVKVYSATGQRVVGYSTNFNADLVDEDGRKKNSQVSILEMYGQNTEITIKSSDGPDMIVIESAKSY